jgi:hypothetical protein
VSYLIQRRKLQPAEWEKLQGVLRNLARTGDYLGWGLRVQKLVSGWMQERYDRGYQCGYKRGMRRTEREGLEDWEQDD